jgi:translation initiation factor 3 subunit L
VSFSADPIFLILYRELYYRHVYSRLQPNIDDRFHSYENSCELFNYLLSQLKVKKHLFLDATYLSFFFADSDGPVGLELPEQWLWDIIDEFIYQYQVFCTWRSKISSKTQDELTMLAEGGPVCHSSTFKSIFFSNYIFSQVWSSYSVLNVLYSLMQKSKINEYIVAQRAGKSPEEIAFVLSFAKNPCPPSDPLSVVVRSSANTANVLYTECLAISASLVYSASTCISVISHLPSKSCRAWN